MFAHHRKFAPVKKNWQKLKIKAKIIVFYYNNIVGLHVKAILLF